MKHKLLFTFLVLICSTTVFAQTTRYWVGGTGQWQDPYHWAAISNGNPGIGEPLATDTVVFDANSFNTNTDTVFIASYASANYFNMLGLQGTNIHPTIILGGGSLTGSPCKLKIYGSMFLSPGTNLVVNDSLIFAGNAFSVGITTSNNEIKAYDVTGREGIYIKNLGQVYLADSLKMYDLKLQQDSGELFIGSYLKARTISSSAHITMQANAQIITNQWLEEDDTAAVVSMDNSATLQVIPQDVGVHNFFYGQGQNYTNVVLDACVGGNSSMQLYGDTCYISHLTFSYAHCTAAEPTAIVEVLGKVMFDTLTFDNTNNYFTELKCNESYQGELYFSAPNEVCLKNVCNNASYPVHFDGVGKSAFYMLDTATIANGCTYGDSVSLNNKLNYMYSSITGSVRYNGGSLPVTKGEVILYGIDDNTGVWTAIDTSGIDGSSNYILTPSTNYTKYAIKAIPDETIHPDLDGGYYYWDERAEEEKVVTISDSLNGNFVAKPCSDGGWLSYDFKLELMQSAIVPPGTAEVNGTIYKVNGFGNRMQGINAVGVASVKVVLGKDPGGQSVQRTTTGSNGQYSFKAVPAGDYIVYVDVPGFPMDNIYSLSITGDDTLANIDYYVDTNSVYIDTVGTTTLKKIIYKVPTNNISVYPNPSNGDVYIAFTAKQREVVTLKVYNALGQECYQHNYVANEGVNNTKLDKPSFLHEGIYYVMLRSSTMNSIERISIIK